MIISNSFFITALMFKDNTPVSIINLNQYVNQKETDYCVIQFYAEYLTYMVSIENIREFIKKYGYWNIIGFIDEYYGDIIGDYSNKKDEDYRELYLYFIHIYNDIMFGWIDIDAFKYRTKNIKL